MRLNIAIIADFDRKFEPLPATDVAIAHAAGALGVRYQRQWIPSADAARWSESGLNEWAGVIVGPGSPLRNPGGRAYADHESVLRAIRNVRCANVPTLGTCAGFQHLALEYLRNVVGIRDASASYYDDGGTHVIAPLTCSLRGQRLPVLLRRGSRAHACYGADETEEQYYCQFGIKSEFEPQLDAAGLQITGTDGNDGEARIVELRGHDFFLGTCFVPQLSSTRARPHPLILAFLQAASRLPLVAT